LLTAEALTNRAEVRRLLKEAGVRPSKRLGQNFLVDAAAIEAIRAATSGIDPQQIIEIGPGLGAVTHALAELGVPVIGVEVDHRLAELLSVTTAALEGVEIIRADALAFDLGSDDLAWGRQASRRVVVGSIPYSITAPLLKHIVDHRQSLAGAVLVTQREVAEKVAASPGSEGSALGIMVQAFCDVQVLRRIPRGAFLPVPDVDSTLWTLRFLEAPRFEADEDLFFQVVRCLFGKRRKMIRGALRDLLDPEQVQAVLLDAGLDGSLRGEALDFDSLDRLAMAYERNRASE